MGQSAQTFQLAHVAWPLRSPGNLVALKVASWYFSFALLWIFSTDWFARSIVSEAHFEQYSMSKGFLFVVITSVLLFVLVRRQIAALAESRNQEARVAAELRESEERLALALRAGDFGVFDRNLLTGCISWDRAMYRLWGMPEERTVTVESFEAHVRKDDWDALRRAVERALDPAGPRHYQCEFRIVRPSDGAERWMFADGGVLFDGDKPVRDVGVVQDITERKRSEAAMANALRLEAIAQLAGGVAHDFNNLLSVIAGNLELAEARTADEVTRDLLRRAQDAAENGGALNRRLLSLAKKRMLKPQRLSLNSRVEETAKLLTSTLGEQVTVTTNLAADLWSTHADPGEVDSAILNVAANARDAMADGGRITIATSNVMLDAGAAAELGPEARAGAYVRLMIADDGPGMAQDVLDKAMDPFFTTKGSAAGTGLGLTSVASFAKQTGGFTVVESAPDRGCAVSLYLPRATEEAALAVKATFPRGDGELVLVVEDDDQVRRVTLKRLEALGYSVEEASTGAMAIEHLKAGAPVRLVLSDIVMPGGATGYDLARWVASNRPEIKVILCSGYSEGDRRGDTKSFGGDVAVLAKPYGREQLASALSKAFASVKPG
jgi:PAS domain S-box-containing protein